MHRFFVAALVLALSFFAAPALAVQGSGCMPVVGTVSGVEFAEDINAALAALISSNSGGAAPTTDCSGQTIVGQQWFDTSLSTPAWRVWDGSQGLAAGYFDLTNHIWMPVVGGGVASLASAATIDLCNYNGSLSPQNYLTITGTVTITSFGTSCQVGQIKFLAFTGITVLTYNASLIVTQTGLSITTAPGDDAQVIYLGGGLWRIISYQAVGGSVPTGVILPTGGATADPGYLLAYGQCVSQTTYPALNARIGNGFGSCPSGQFAVPDLRGRVPAGADNMGGAAANRLTIFSAVLGNTSGVQSSVVAGANLASFDLPYTDNGHLHTYVPHNAGNDFGATPGSAGPFLIHNTDAAFNTSSNTIGISIHSGGLSQPLPTIPPMQVFNYQIKY